MYVLFIGVYLIGQITNGNLVTGVDIIYHLNSLLINVNDLILIDCRLVWEVSWGFPNGILSCVLIDDVHFDRGLLLCVLSDGVCKAQVRTKSCI